MEPELITSCDCPEQEGVAEEKGLMSAEEEKEATTRDLEIKINSIKTDLSKLQSVHLLLSFQT